jgi:hypothetical protein
VHLLRADSADHPLFDVATAVTDAGGAFTLFGVPPGQYVARVVKTPWPAGQGRLGQCGGTGAISFVCSISGGTGTPETPTEPLLYAERRVTITDESVRDVTMTLRAGGRVSGRVDFEGSTARPTETQLAAVGVSLERADGQTAQPAGGFDITLPGRLAADGRFTTASTAPGRYLVRIANPPKGWTLKSALSEGRDLSETPFALDGDVSAVVVTFTDRTAKIEGPVVGSNGQGDERAMVLLFPTDSTTWVDYGRTSRRVRSMPTPGGKFSLAGPPEGEYYLIAIQADLAVDWQDPAVLERIATQADRVFVQEGQPLTHALQTQRIQ